MNIHTKRGNLSAYGLSCGYAERYTTKDVRIELSKEYCCYHVKASGKTHEGKWQEWQSFDTLTEARKALSRIKKEGLK